MVKDWMGIMIGLEWNCVNMDLMVKKKPNGFKINQWIQELVVLVVDNLVQIFTLVHKDVNMIDKELKIQTGKAM